MADTYVQITNTGQTVFSLPFSSNYLLKSHVKVYKGRDLLAETQTATLSEGTDYTFSSATQITLSTGLASGVELTIQRQTPKDLQLSPWNDGSNLTAEALNKADLQCLYFTQEQGDLNALGAIKAIAATTASTNAVTTANAAQTTANAALSRGGGTMTGAIAMGTNKVTGVGDPTAAQDAVTKAYLERTGSIASAQILNGTIVNTDVNTSAAIDGTKVSPNFGSQNIVTSGTVDGRDVSADGIKLDSCDIGSKDDQTPAEIRTAVDAATNSNVYTDAEKTKLAGCDTGAKDDQTAAEIRTLVGSASDSNVFTDTLKNKLDGCDTGAKDDQTAAEIKTLIATSPLDASHIAANAVGDSEIATGALDNRYYTETESDARYFNVSTGDTIKDGDTFPDNDTTIATTAAINDRIIDLVDDVGGFVPIANETSFPNANPDVNNGTGTLVSIKALSSNLTSNGSGVATIANGTVGNSTVTITGLANSTTYSSSYGMIVETTTTLNTYTFHRQVPIATEVTTVAAKATEIGRLGTTAAVEDLSILGTTAVVADLAILGTTDVVSDMNTLATSDVVSDMNTLAVTSVINNMDTCATNVSNINNVGGSISNVNTVAGNLSGVNSFGERYRVASSAPGSGNDEGDLYFDTTANELKVYNGSQWQGGVTASGNFASTTGNTFTGANNHGDNVKVQLGAGNDLYLQHNGTDSNIINSTGNLYIQNTGDDINIRAQDDINLQVQNGETGINIIGNGAVELYYDNVKKFETTSGGATVTGTLTTTSGINAGNNISLNDNHKVKFGNGDDLQIYHNGIDNYIIGTTGDTVIRAADEVKLQSYVGSENMLVADYNGSVELYYDGVKKLNTNSTGVIIQGNANVSDSSGYGGSANHFFSAGNSNDLKIYHHGSWGSSYINNSGSGALFLESQDLRFRKSDGQELYFQAVANGAVELYYDNSKKFETTSVGVDVTGILQCNEFKLLDNEHAKFGTGEDLRIYHDGSNSYIKDAGTGGIYIDTSFLHVRQGSAESMINAIADGAVELYHNNSKKLETTSGGATVTGTVTATSFSGSGANLTNLPATSGALTATATGAIAANKPVIIKTDGTVEQVVETTTAISGDNSGNKAVFANTSDYRGATIRYVPAGDYYVLVYQIYSSNSSRYLRARTATVAANGTITLGNETNVNGTRKVQEYTSVYDPDQEKVLIMYTDAESGYYVKTRYAYSTDGTNLSFGNNTTVTSSGTAQNLAVAYNKGINKFMMAYKLSDYYRVRVGTGSSNSVSWTGETTVESNEVENILIAADDTSSFVCYWRDKSGGSDNNQPAMRGVSVSGTTPSVGSKTVLSTRELQGNPPKMYLGFHEALNRFIIMYNVDVDGTKMKVLSISGNTITSGNEVGFSSTNAAPFGSMEYDEDLEELFLYYADGENNGYSHLQVRKLEIVNETSHAPGQISVHSKYEIIAESAASTTNDNYNKGGEGLTRTGVGPTHSLITYRYQTDDKGYVKAVAVKSKTSNITATNYLGISQAAYSNSNTATIQTIGALNEGQSSLTPGSKYYVKSDGTLSTTAGNPSVEAGMAVAATKLIVKG